MKVVIIARDRLHCLRRLADWLQDEAHADVTIFDNASTYQPLLDWYNSDECSHTVFYSSYNHYKTGPWRSGLLKRLVEGERFYAVTDPDLDPADCPPDVLEHLAAGLVDYPRHIKAGVSLQIDDIPDANPMKAKILSKVARHWEHRVEPEASFFRAPTDSTLAVYWADRVEKIYTGKSRIETEPSIRSDRPYTMRHIDWYLGEREITPDDHYYFERSIRNGYGRQAWSKICRPHEENAK